MNFKKATNLLKKSWIRQKNIDPKRWSLRQIARELKLSPGYLSKVFSGQMSLTEDLAKKLIVNLKVDDLNRNMILSNFDKSYKKVSSSRAKKETKIDEYALPNESTEWLLKRWYNLSILDLMTTEGFKSDAVWIAGRLGISIQETEQSLKKLVEEGLAFVDENGIYKKKYIKMRFPTVIPKVLIREHHKAQMNRAIQIMETRLTPKDFNNRLIVGLSIASNPERLQDVKDFLHAALYEAAEMLSDDSCTEVYQLNFQLFPQTK